MSIQRLTGLLSVLIAISGVIGLTSSAPALAAACSGTPATSLSDLTTKINAASAGSVICINGGSYTGNLSISKANAGPTDITIQPVPGSAVTIGGSVSFSATAKHLVLHNFTITGGVSINSDTSQAASFITIDHNDISGGGYGVMLDSYDCNLIPCGTGRHEWISDITITGNKVHGYGASNGGEDALRIQHSKNVTISYNELYDNIQGNPNVHTDNLQFYNNAQNITYDHNYNHDNNSQNFFIKDGDASNVTLSNNLFVRNNKANISENTINMYGVTNLVMTHNTEWSDNGNVLQGNTGDVSATNNVFKQWCTSACGSWTITANTNNLIGGSPSFVNTAADDYRLNDGSGRGVDWKPSDYTYGPIISGGSTGTGKYHAADLAALMSHYGQTGASSATGDLDSDGAVTAYDLSRLLADYTP